MNTRGQMSEAVPTSIFSTLSGGSQGAYTYYCRGNVSIDTWTGNIVLMGSRLAVREWNLAMRYLAPVLAFTGDVYMTGHVERLHRQDRRFHWRQLIVAIETILLFMVGFLPQDMNMAVNIIVSFIHALQVDVSRKIKESPYATTTYTGDPCSAAESLYWYRHTDKKNHRDKCIRYYGVIGILAVGAVVSSVPTVYLRERTMWVSCELLLVSFPIMFVKEDIEGEHRQKLPRKEVEIYGK